MATPSAGRSAWLITAICVGLILALVAAYIGVMHLLVDLSRVENEHEASRRDSGYLYLHVVFLLGAATIGFLAGKWLNGLGIAFATLFATSLVVAMLTVQLSSYELACHGHNDVVRHWQC